MTIQRGRILVVDDNELSLLLLSQAVTAQGHIVETAHDGLEALAKLRAAKPAFDVVLLDILMPNLDGYQTLEQIKGDDALKIIPVIMVSAIDEMESIVRCIQIGATDYLPKPADSSLLRARLNASLDTKRLRDLEREYLEQVGWVVKAAADVEAGTFDPEGLDRVAVRNDALGQLARVFQQMAEEISAREQSLKSESRAKSAFIGMISHELRTPFASANLSLDLVKRYVERKMLAEADDQIRQLEHELKEGRRLIDNMISYATMMSKQTPLRLRRANVNVLILDVVTLLGNMAGTRNIDLRLDVDQTLPEMRLDKEKMSEAMYHLVHNAIKFNHDGGTVSVSCHVKDSQLVFIVDDTGQGIPANQIATVWEAFAQVADRVQRSVEGVGLGLPLVKYVIEAHDGEVFAQSKEGVGSTFGFKMPLEKYIKGQVSPK
jgi:signal transduction histidine kinase